MDTNVGWDMDSMILSCEGSDREQEDVGQGNTRETLVAETHPESPRKTLDAEDLEPSPSTFRFSSQHDWKPKKEKHKERRKTKTETVCRKQQ